MGSAKVAFTIDEQVLKKLDDLVEKRTFANRSQAIQQAVKEKIDRLEHGRLAEECAKMDKHFEQNMADEGLAGDMEEWPEY
ncbi:MAG: ribbon-helix-helix domain-containing protein [bacterium]|nr:ribbon-helix-helix domain-containing protein [bacterium]